MSSLQFKLPGHLFVPFACRKEEIAKIRPVAVSADGTYFTSEIHCYHIDRDTEDALRLTNFFDAWALERGDEVTDPREAIGRMRELTKDFGNLQTNKERLFVDLYFSYLESLWDWTMDEPGFLLAVEVPSDHPWEEHGIPVEALFGALLPLPQAHLWVRDLLGDQIAPPSVMYKVDFAFWTGRKLIAVEIDGPSHYDLYGDIRPDHIRKDRALRNAGVEVVHILNDELRKGGTRSLERILPRSIRYGWISNLPLRTRNPMAGRRAA